MALHITPSFAAPLRPLQTLERNPTRQRRDFSGMWISLPKHPIPQSLVEISPWWSSFWWFFHHRQFDRFGNVLRRTTRHLRLSCPPRWWHSHHGSLILLQFLGFWVFFPPFWFCFHLIAFFFLDRKDQYFAEGR